MTGKYINRRETETQRKRGGITIGSRSDRLGSDRRLLAKRNIKKYYTQNTIGQTRDPARLRYSGGGQTVYGGIPV